MLASARSHLGSRVAFAASFFAPTHPTESEQSSHRRAAPTGESRRVGAFPPRMMTAVYASGQILGDTRTAFIGVGFWCDLAVEKMSKGTR